nr:immunoglobulin heavy chain junction region [Macaca mulatta]
CARGGNSLFDDW